MVSLLFKDNFIVVKLFVILSSANILHLALAQSTLSQQHTQQELQSSITECPKDDASCKIDPVGFEFISQLHSKIDDDKDGSLDREESREFIRDDLKHSDSVATRQKNLHGGDDHITVVDLWHLWVSSEVYNWTVNEVVDWLITIVELPQYANAFRENAVDGKVLPRLSAIQSTLVNQLGIKNAVHRQKLGVKATDLVLFGPPKFAHNYKKDFALGVSVLVAVLGCYYAYTQQRSAQTQVQKVMKDLNSLQYAEDALSQLQQQLEAAEKQQLDVINDKMKLERQLRAEVDAARAEAEKLRHQEISEEGDDGGSVGEQLQEVRLALLEAERRLQENSCLSAPDLQQWLRRTYDIETKYFNEKRTAAEKQLKAAKEMCDKIKKQKGKFLGSFRVAHTTSLDETDSRIMSVRTALEDVKIELQERTGRWKQIERICGFGIVEDVPVQNLSSSKLHGSADDIDNDSTSSSSNGLTGGSVRERNTGSSIHGASDSLKSRSFDTNLTQQQPVKFSSLRTRNERSAPALSSDDGK